MTDAEISRKPAGFFAVARVGFMHEEPWLEIPLAAAAIGSGWEEVSGSNIQALTVECRNTPKLTKGELRVVRD
jgi:hypothetical protein